MEGNHAASLHLRHQAVGILTSNDEPRASMQQSAQQTYTYSNASSARHSSLEFSLSLARSTCNTTGTVTNGRSNSLDTAGRSSSYAQPSQIGQHPHGAHFVLDSTSYLQRLVLAEGESFSFLSMAGCSGRRLAPQVPSNPAFSAGTASAPAAKLMTRSSHTLPYSANLPSSCPVAKEGSSGEIEAKQGTSACAADSKGEDGKTPLPAVTVTAQCTGASLASGKQSSSLLASMKRTANGVVSKLKHMAPSSHRKRNIAAAYSQSKLQQAQEAPPAATSDHNAPNLIAGPETVAQSTADAWDAYFMIDNGTPQGPSPRRVHTPIDASSTMGLSGKARMAGAGVQTGGSGRMPGAQAPAAGVGGGGGWCPSAATMAEQERVWRELSSMRAVQHASASHSCGTAVITACTNTGIATSTALDSACGPASANTLAGLTSTLYSGPRLTSIEGFLQSGSQAESAAYRRMSAAAATSGNPCCMEVGTLTLAFMPRHSLKHATSKALPAEEASAATCSPWHATASLSQQSLPPVAAPASAPEVVMLWPLCLPASSHVNATSCVEVCVERAVDARQPEASSLKTAVTHANAAVQLHGKRMDVSFVLSGSHLASEATKTCRQDEDVHTEAGRRRLSFASASAVLPALPSMQVLNVFASLEGVPAGAVGAVDSCETAIVGPSTNLLAAPAEVIDELHALFAAHVKAFMLASTPRVQAFSPRTLEHSPVTGSFSTYSSAPGAHASSLSASILQEIDSLSLPSIATAPWRLSTPVWGAARAVWGATLQPLLDDITYLVQCVPSCFTHGLLEWDRAMYCETLARMVATLEQNGAWRTMSLMMMHSAVHGVVLKCRGSVLCAEDGGLAPERLEQLLVGALHSEVSIAHVGVPPPSRVDTSEGAAGLVPIPTGFMADTITCYEGSDVDGNTGSSHGSLMPCMINPLNFTGFSLGESMGSIGMAAGRSLGAVAWPWQRGHQTLAAHGHTVSGYAYSTPAPSQPPSIAPGSPASPQMRTAKSMQGVLQTEDASVGSASGAHAQPNALFEMARGNANGEDSLDNARKHLPPIRTSRLSMDACFAALQSKQKDAPAHMQPSADGLLRPSTATGTMWCGSSSGMLAAGPGALTGTSCSTPGGAVRNGNGGTMLLMPLPEGLPTPDASTSAAAVVLTAWRRRRSSMDTPLSARIECKRMDAACMGSSARRGGNASMDGSCLDEARRHATQQDERPGLQPVEAVQAWYGLSEVGAMLEACAGPGQVLPLQEAQQPLQMLDAPVAIAAAQSDVLPTKPGSSSGSSHCDDDASAPAEWRASGLSDGAASALSLGSAQAAPSGQYSSSVIDSVAYSMDKHSTKHSSQPLSTVQSTAQSACGAAAFDAQRCLLPYAAGVRAACLGTGSAPQLQGVCIQPAPVPAQSMMDVLLDRGMLVLVAFIAFVLHSLMSVGR